MEEAFTISWKKALFGTMGTGGRQPQEFTANLCFLGAQVLYLSLSPFSQQDLFFMEHCMLDRPLDLSTGT
jgi:hypothetical protein